MTLNDLIPVLDLRVLVEGDLTRPVTGGSCGDLLSWVMGRAEADSAWITVMGNVNAVAVAVLADVSCILLAESAPLDDAAREKAAQQNVTVLQSDESIYRLAVKLGKALA
ncbi:MAG: hypothetical protein ACOYJY_04230 [Acutalibacteraceae bacterium]|jgi:hypothetical protein